MSRAAATVTTPDALVAPPAKSPYRPETALEFLAGHDAFLSAGGALDAVRRAGAAGFAAAGVPGPALERWKYTNLPPAVRGLGGAVAAPATFRISGPDGPGGLDGLDGLARPLAGMLAAGAALPDWLRALLAAPAAGAAQYRDTALWDLGQAWLRDGIVVDIPAGMIVENPVDISIAAPAAGFSALRLVVRLGAGASLTLVERHEGDDRAWLNQTTQVIVGANARLNHYRLQQTGPAAIHTHTSHAAVARDGTYETLTMTTGAGLSRNQAHVTLTESNASCFLYGINMLRGKQSGDTTLTVEHQAPHCPSNQFYRSVLDGQAKGVFQGKVHVHQAAQKTDGYQLSNALILSEGAEMDTKPELEIYADDVKCSHGATTGRLDERALFYLRSRGLPEAEARALLVQAFVHEVVEKLADKSVENDVAAAIAAWLAVP